MQEPPKRPKGNNSFDFITETFHTWIDTGELCPEGSIPIRRTTEGDVLRASSIGRFGKKLARGVRRDTMSSDHEVSIYSYIYTIAKQT